MKSLGSPQGRAKCRPGQLFAVRDVGEATTPLVLHCRPHGPVKSDPYVLALVNGPQAKTIVTNARSHRAHSAQPLRPSLSLSSLLGSPPAGHPEGCELTAAAAPVKMSSPSVSLSPASGSDPPAAPSDSGSKPGKGGGSLSEALQPPPPDAIFLHPRRKPQQQLYRERAPRAKRSRGTRSGIVVTNPAGRTGLGLRAEPSRWGRGRPAHRLCPSNPSPASQR